MSKIAYSIADIETLLKDDRYVKVAGVDTNGILRGKILSKKKFLATLKHGFGKCSPNS
jgi:glutamine synthetase